MTADALDFVRKEFRADEHLKWAGCPNPARYAMINGLYVCLFGILLTAFGILAEYMAFAWDAPVSEHSMAILFIAIGLAMSVRPIWHYWTALRTIYVVTDQRLLVFVDFFGRNIERYGPPFEIKHRIYSDGSGSIFVSREQPAGNDVAPHESTIGLYAIPKVSEVEHHILEIGHAAT